MKYYCYYHFHITLLLLLVCSIQSFGQESFTESHPVYGPSLKLARDGDLDAAQALLKGKENTEDPTYLLVSGEINMRKGRNDLAVDCFKNALNTYESEGKTNSSEAAQCLSNLGVAYWATGNNTMSLEQHLQAMTIRQELFGNKHQAVAASYNDIGLVYSQNDPEKALEYYEKALGIYINSLGESNEKTANAYINIGIVNSQIEFYGDAVNNIKKALDIQMALYPEGHPKEAFSYSTLGRVYSAMGNLRDARKYQRKALAIYKKFYGSKHPEIAETYNLIGTIEQQEGNFKEAVNQFHAAIMANVPDFHNPDPYATPPTAKYYNPNTLLVSMMMKAQAFEALHYNKTLKTKDLTVALNTLQHCDTLIDKIRYLRVNKKDKIAFSATAAEVYEDAIRVAMNVEAISLNKKHYRELAFYFSEKSKSSVLLESIADANAKSFANIPKNLLEEEKSLKADIAYYERKLADKPTAETAKKYQGLLYKTNTQYRRFTQRLEQEYPEYFELKYTKDMPSTAKIQGLLDKNTALISYSILEKTNQLYIFTITQKGFKVTSVPLFADFDKYITGLRNAIYFDVKATYVQTSRMLYKQLFPRGIPNQVEKLVIVPTGRLGIIPFEALLTSNTKEAAGASYQALPYLIKNWSVSYEYAASLFYQNAKKRGKRNNQLGISLFAPVDFSANDTPFLPTLPATAQEAKAIDEIFKSQNQNASLFLQSDANEQLVKSKALTKFSHLHFATHGVVNESHPELSKIFLSPNTSTQDDGSLYSGEIYNLQLNASLVTLSACETGLGKVSKGEGIIGLSRALLYAGAKNLVVSLWSVADESTAELMVDFYRGYLATEKQEAYSRSLRKAKQNMIRSSNYARPYYWAPFVLIGQ